MLHALHCRKTVAMKTPMSTTQDKVYIGSWGSFTCAPRNLPSNRFQLAQAPKSALHFCPGKYRLYWNRFHIGTGSRYPTLPMSHKSLSDVHFFLTEMLIPKR